MIGTSNNGLRQVTVSGNNAGGVQLGFVGTTASSTVVSGLQGLLGEITISADSTANTLTFYDGTSTSGAVIYKLVTPTTVPVTQVFPNRQFLTGLFLVNTGGTTVNINIGIL